MLVPGGEQVTGQLLKAPAASPAGPEGAIPSALE